MAFMAILIIDGAQAGAPTLNNALSIPNEDRVDGSQPMVFAIEYNDPDGDIPEIVVSFAVTLDTIT